MTSLPHEQPATQQILLQGELHETRRFGADGRVLEEQAHTQILTERRH
jgi:hypothetical protein